MRIGDPPLPKVGAVCGKAARTVLCGGRSAMSVPTAIWSCPLLHLLRSPIGTKPRCTAVQQVVGYWKCCGPSALLGRTAAHDLKPTCVSDCTSHATFISRGQRCIRGG